MEKKELKFYETPVMEVVEMEAKVSLLAGSDTGTGGIGSGDGGLEELD